MRLRERHGEVALPHEVPCLAVSRDSISAPESSIKTLLFIFSFSWNSERGQVFCCMVLMV